MDRNRSHQDLKLVFTKCDTCEKYEKTAPDSSRHVGIKLECYHDQRSYVS